MLPAATLFLIWLAHQNKVQPEAELEPLDDLEQALQLLGDDEELELNERP